MDLNKACNILDLSIMQLTPKNIKKAYYKKARQWHPDKNISSVSSCKFQEIKNAYEFLLREIEHLDNDSLMAYLIKLGLDITYEDLVSIIINAHKEYYPILIKYASLFGIVDDPIIGHNESNCICIEPSIENLFNYDIYNLDTGNGDIYCIPLWHHQLEIDEKDRTLFVKIKPYIPKNIIIDQDNNVHLYKPIFKHTVCIRETIDIFIANTKFEVVVTSLTPLVQATCFNNRGIPRINDDDLLSVACISNVYIHLMLV